jgi:hypothetical protein
MLEEVNVGEERIRKILIIIVRGQQRKNGIIKMMSLARATTQMVIMMTGYKLQKSHQTK